MMFDEKGRLVVSIGKTTAADVDIVDAGGLITATEVESALQEIFGDYQAGGVARTLGGDLDANGNSINNLLGIGAVPISAAQWGWLGGFDPTCLARAYLTADQDNLVNSVWTKILLDAENFDVGGDFDLANNRFVAPITGYYQVNGEVLFNNAVVDKRYAMAIYVNGAAYVGQQINSSYANAFVGGIASDIIYIVAGQFIELYAFSASGDNTVDVTGGTAATSLSIHFLGK